MPPQVSIIVPNWNGREFLARCIGSITQAAAESGLTCETLVVDDASGDDSREILARQFPSVRLLHNPVNLGFGATCNRAARECGGEVVVFLNNDLVAKPQLVRELAQPLFDDPSLFGVSGKTVDWRTGAPNHLNMIARWVDGTFALEYSDSSASCPTMFLQGGSCAVRRGAFLKLGGFCDLFAPGYWEDYDLSYLALKAGWKNLYNPRAIGYHFGQGSMIRAFGEERVQVMKERNRERFALLNLTDSDLLAEHLKGVSWRTAFAAEPRLRVRLKAMAECMGDLSALLAEKKRRAPLLRKTDAEVLSAFATDNAAG